MFDLKDIETNYRSLSSEKLLRLAQSSENLREDVILILKNELNRRGLTEIIANLENRKPVEALTIEELQDWIKQRLSTGESVESIKLDLQDHGINSFDLLYEDRKLKNEAVEYINVLREKEVSEYEIEEGVKSTFGIENDDLETLKTERKTRGKYNLIIGYSLVGGIGIMSLMALASGHPHLGGAGAVTIGVLRIIKGHRQRK